MNKILLGLLMLALTACGFEQVDTGYRGIETRYGEVQGEPLPEGLHFYNPFTSDIVEYPVRQQKYEEEVSSFTKDNQELMITFALIWSPVPSHVHILYRDNGSAELVAENILKTAVLGSLKDAIGSVDANEITGKRAEVTHKALDAIKAALADKHLNISDLQFTNLRFHKEFQNAVEEKVVASQRAQKAINETLRIQEEAKQTVETAKAAAESMRIKSQALSQNRALIDYELAKKWDGVLPQIMMGNGTIPMIDLKSLTNKKGE